MAQSTPIARALISVSDKTGLVDFARALSAKGVAILSTGGSAAAIRDAGIPVTEVADHTRITSYNVCYTKLLRLGTAFAALLAGLARITSYNVCYTKLLRSNRRKGNTKRFSDLECLIRLNTR